MNFLKPGIFTSGNLKDDLYTLFAKFIRTKDIKTVAHDQSDKTTLKKCLTIVDLTSLGVGSCVGTGMYLVCGLVAKKYAGPAVLFSFVIAAVASILSGACYAEFGVRVPHTTGSAYMYSYVTVGELIAFIIGWNMILEYLIGTAACACALSACLDSISRGTMNEGVQQTVGTILGHTPDLLAFAITLLMTVILALGVKRSLAFNHILNVVNFSSWVFLMSAGLFYIDVDNWSNFLPYGWAGVFEGAATCFYAFIGFDIIATTGEEAHNAKRSIPIAIFLSLIIILMAYVTVSVMLTLIVPYNEVSTSSALVSLFGQVGARKCQLVVMLGAIAGLTVSMFGSMFPMPRIIYAMAKDGLLFKSFSPIFEWTGTPLIATVVSGITAAIAALFFNLQILVEMMSIGTLLAYTLVSTCVLILRYQPYSTNIIELIPEALKTPINGTTGLIVCEKKVSCHVQDGTNSSPKSSKSGKSQSSDTNKRSVIVRRITRSSPDSDDLMDDDNDDDDDDDDDVHGPGCTNDNQKLVTDKRDKKHYGTTLHRITPVPKTIDEKVSEKMDDIKQRFQVLTYLCPALFPWVEHGPATEESGQMVLCIVFVLYVLILTLDVIMVYGSRPFSTFNSLLVYTLIFAIVILTSIISRKPQNRKDLLFSTPAVPFVPVIAIAVNIYLILNLSILTLIRFIVWMIIGIIIYFYYGIKYSSLETNLADTDNHDRNDDRAADTTKSKNLTVEQPIQYSTRPASLETNKAGSSTLTKNDLFVSPSSFPKWED